MRYAKFIIAALTAALQAVNGLLPLGSSATQWVGFALAVLGAIGVWLVPNATAKQSNSPAAPYAGR